MLILEFVLSSQPLKDNEPQPFFPFQNVIIVSLQFFEIIELMGYYEKMRKYEKQLNGDQEGPGSDDNE